ncbi:MAG TPA: hypothetical protein QGF63_16415 [Alphaproteobacteria bacterium]|jgi:hypothetical protein|nr:hypothetical protein [Alphaproteobacteria bacterium]MDP6271521.1 hypothetical protein [Alphaproteobacteria bacterium]MDP7429430.1 hypothetical protein [Alphaproteobacteria bacterium]HJM51416.1 hypothetical protein [Alphaproteobacteria bacterium]|tara:strand:- start:256 stop:525 length:270 start_codon:yes stop_codon:yes gene_type:complete
MMHLLRRKPRHFDEVAVGGLYHRLLATNVSETAEIVALAEDAYGVPHVRFELTAHLSGKILDTGQRTLATAAFLADFRPGPPQELAAAS